MNITLVIASLRSGGAERVVVHLAKGFAAAGHEVAVVTTDDSSTDFYTLPESTRRTVIPTDCQTGLLNSIARNTRGVARLRRAILDTGPDAVISFITKTNVQVLVALVGTGIPVFASEQVDPREVPRGPFWGPLRRISYRWTKKLVSASAGVDQFFGWLPKQTRAVIHNPVDIEEVQTACDTPAVGFQPPNAPFLVGMGRLVHQKGFERLLDAFAILGPDHSDWQLVILGEGEHRDRLERQIDSLGLSERVQLPGRMANPFSIIRQADLFVLPSRFEGFGNVLIEAMACSTPVIAFDCPSGPNEIIHDNIDGILVPEGDIASLAAAMGQLIEDPDRRQQIADEGRARSQAFCIEPTVAAWERLLAAA